MPTLSEAIQALGYFGLAAAAIVYLKSNVQKSKSAESLALADIRGERIDDLEKHVERLEKEMRREREEMRREREAMSKRLTHLQGQVDAAIALKSSEIIAGVVSGLKPFLDDT